jgi:glycosyltransferase involved in cell wall biosynthesis
MPNAALDELLAPASVEPARGAQLVSVIVPCRNERAYIAACLESLAAQTWPKSKLEVLVVDGLSDDGTRDIVAAHTARFPWLRLLDNPQRVTPSALNIGIRESSGQIVCRVDVHCKYPNDYIATLVRTLDTSGADNAGGMCRTRPADGRPMSRGIAAALSHPLAVGNAHFRIGATAPRWVDTVPFGCYRRSVFERIGLFDEELVRNQDDEFNHRLLKHGGRILLVPSIVIDYYARNSIPKLARMMFQYGYFKPLCAKKLGRVSTARQLVPPAFVAVLGVSLLLAPWSMVMRAVLALIVSLYAALVFAAAARQLPPHGGAVAARFAIAIPVIHLSYGSGFLRGLWDHVIRARARRGTDPAAQLQPSR